MSNPFRNMEHPFFGLDADKMPTSHYGRALRVAAAAMAELYMKADLDNRRNMVEDVALNADKYLREIMGWPTNESSAVVAELTTSAKKFAQNTKVTRENFHTIAAHHIEALNELIHVAKNYGLIMKLDLIDHGDFDFSHAEIHAEIDQIEKPYVVQRVCHARGSHPIWFLTDDGKWTADLNYAARYADEDEAKQHVFNEEIMLGLDEDEYVGFKKVD